MYRSILLGSNARSSILAKIPELHHRYVDRHILGDWTLTTLPGWLTVVGWQAFAASGGYLSGTLIQGLIALTNPDYNFQRWHGTLLFWAVILVAVIVNTVVSSLLPKLECLILIIHVLGFFAILIPMVYMSPHGSAKDVFTMFLNKGGWQTTGLSFFIGLAGNVFSFLGRSSFSAKFCCSCSHLNTGTDAAIHVCTTAVFAVELRY